MSLWEQERERRTVNPILSSRVSSFPRVSSACDAQRTLALLGGGWTAPELRESATKKTMTVWNTSQCQPPNSSVTSDPDELTEQRISTPIDLNVFLGKEAELTKERFKEYRASVKLTFQAVCKDRIQLQFSAKALGPATYLKVNFKFTIST